MLTTRLRTRWARLLLGAVAFAAATAIPATGRGLPAAPWEAAEPCTAGDPGPAPARPGPASGATHAGHHCDGCIGGADLVAPPASPRAASPPAPDCATAAKPVDDARVASARAHTARPPRGPPPA